MELTGQFRMGSQNNRQRLKDKKSDIRDQKRYRDHDSDDVRVRAETGD